MHRIKVDKIEYSSDGTSDYVFSCHQPNITFEEIPGHLYFDTIGEYPIISHLQKLSEVQRENYIWELFQTHIIPKIGIGETLYLNGTFTKKIYDYLRNIYKDFGYFIPGENRYELPVKAPILLGVDIVNLVYTPHRKPSVYLSQGAIRANIAALNDGIITRIYIQPTDIELSQYLKQSHIQLQRLAYALELGWSTISPQISLQKFILKADSPSWNEVPNE